MPKPASIGKRLAAYCIDLCILALLVIVPFSDVLVVLAPSTPFDTGNEGSVFFVTLLMCFMMYAYTVMLENRYGQTVGKMILGLYVWHKKRQTRHVLMRNAYYLAIPLLGPLVVIDALTLVFTKNKQRALDLLAGTMVVSHG